MGKKIAFLLGFCIIFGILISGTVALDTPYSLSGHVYDDVPNPVVGASMSFENLNTNEFIYYTSTSGGEYQQDAANFASGYSDADVIRYNTSYGAYINSTNAAINVVGGGTLLDIYLSLPPPSIPSVSIPSAGGITASASIISWNVNQSANNRVIYGKEVDLSDGVWTGWQNGTSSPSIGISGLETDTDYYYQVWSYNIYDDSFHISYPVSSPYGSFSTLSSNLMSSIDWLNDISGLFNLFGILVIVAITSLILYILMSKESVGTDLLISTVKMLITVGVILSIGIVIFMQLGDL